MSPVDFIQHKRDGGEHSPRELAAFIDSFMAGEVADYQMSAWLMAALLKGLSLDETLALTDALLASGSRLDLSGLGRLVVDKHSTGGVGDKVTMVLAPLVASCGAVFGKMSGRGLGHTGGTIDKLESIPGFRTTLSAAEFASQLGKIGICVCGQSSELAPADNRLYALRDVTATVESNPLIAASILSKKIAGGASAVVLDVKVGSGSFFKTRGHASGVAHLMREVGAKRGIGVEAVMTSMEQPLGYAVGNALEVMEAAETLRGNGPADLVEVVAALAKRLLHLSDLGWSHERAEAEARERLATGAAVGKFREWIAFQGGDTSFIDDPGILPAAAHTATVAATGEGWVEAIDALAIGKAALNLGAGRLHKEDAIDHSVGVVLAAKCGDGVKAGDALATVHARDAESAGSAAAAIQAAYRISAARVEPASVLID
ncbi:MAG: thymidine phosphorylase [Actinobacteria bacterium]|nr:thymidine phosphorylase [Actinomycetota bacterium]